MGGLGGTYVAARSAPLLATIETYEAENLDRARPRDRRDHRGAFAELQKSDSRIGDIRGRGAMQAIELVEAGSKTPASALTGAIAKQAADQGVILLTCGTYGNVIRFLPLLAISDELLREGLQVVADAPASTSDSTTRERI